MTILHKWAYFGIQRCHFLILVSQELNILIIVIYFQVNNFFSKSDYSLSITSFFVE